MKINVLAFGIAKEIVGSPLVQFELTGQATVESLRQTLESRFPRLGQLASYMVAINNEYATGTAVIHPADEIAIIPPVSGG